jgi:hypothetical protein
LGVATSYQCWQVFETSPNPPQQRFFFLSALWHRWQQQPDLDVEVAKIALFWKTKNGYSHYIQSGFGRFLKKFSAPTHTHYLYLLYMF